MNDQIHNFMTRSEKPMAWRSSYEAWYPTQGIPCCVVGVVTVEWEYLLGIS